jgi:hypothetical protein
MEKAVGPKETKEDEKGDPGRPCSGTKMGTNKVLKTLRLCVVA